MSEPFFSRRQNICSLANSFSDNNTTPPYTYKCLADCHVFLQACIAQKAIKDTYVSLTIGDISYRQKPLFDATRSTIVNTLNRGISTQDEPQFHVWLTLADMTIIDFTINDHLRAAGLLEPSNTSHSSVTIWRAERCNGLQYHPLLIDDAFLTRLQKPAH